MKTLSRFLCIVAICCTFIACNNGDDDDTAQTAKKHYYVPIETIKELFDGNDIENIYDYAEKNGFEEWTAGSPTNNVYRVGFLKTFDNSTDSLWIDVRYSADTIQELSFHVSDINVDNLRDMFITYSNECYLLYPSWEARRRMFLEENDWDVLFFDNHSSFIERLKKLDLSKDEVIWEECRNIDKIGYVVSLMQIEYIRYEDLKKSEKEWQYSSYKFAVGFVKNAEFDE
ncbi:MAG: hypothetical protein IJ759_06340 [Bacteroidales bacterium]|nr:hypothetical protein [Bacteroidales bacterium]